MDCDQTNQFIESYLDGELTLSDHRDFEAHITDCNECSTTLEAMRALQTNIRESVYQQAPTSLKHSIQNKLRDYTGEETSKTGWIQWAGIASGFMSFGAVSTWVFLTFLVTSPLQTEFSNNIISAHVRSLMADHATDVISTDRHTVKPWFNGRVDFSPPVKDLDKQGFKLIGGRLDYLDNKAATALIYKRRAHIINLFIFKSKQTNDKQSPVLLQRDGYNLIHWKNSGLEFWGISDLNKKELRHFADLSATF